MAKKRKAGGGKPFGQSSEAVSNAKTKYAVNETFDDPEDEFHAGRDKILLEERPDVKKRRRIEEDNARLDPSDEEVYGYDEPSDEDLDDEDDVDAQEDYQSDEASVEGSDEEEEQLGHFGNSKQDYYDADQIQTEEDALAEEREARRIQQKQLEGMTEADFGFDEGQWLDQGEEESKGQRTVTEKLPELEIPDDMPAEERLKILKGRYPEFEPLAKDFVDLQSTHADLKLAADVAIAVVRSRKRKLDTVDGVFSSVPVPVTKYRALSAYLAAVGMYFALLTSASTTNSNLPISPSELRDHPVFRSLLQCRQLWETAKDIAVSEAEDTTTSDEPDTGLVDTPVVTDVAASAQPPKKQKKRKSRAERAAKAAAQADAEARQARLAAAEASLADLDSLVSLKPTKTVISSAAPARDDVSDFGDETPLTAEEAAAKAQRKKSLRFYSSQIAQKANKRGAASRDAGGDHDLPYKERLRDRQARLIREAERRGAAGSDLGGASDDEEGPTNADREAGGSDDEYYQTITSRTASKKATKSALAAAHAAAAAQNGHVTNITESVGADGKRAISYEISKNKGLTPHRKKDVRNPRVKKRKKFDEKMKKLKGSGQRQVWRGGEGRGGYGGETTGINRSVVRSVKL